jgi:hypothetical protein
LTASDGSAGAGLGASVSLNGSTALVGAVTEITEVGAAYVFAKPSGGWIDTTQIAELTAADSLNDGFGIAVALRGQTAAVGAFFHTHRLNIGEGGVYVFAEPTGGWKNTNGNILLTGSDARHGTWFGHSVALNGSVLVVGAPLFQNQGSAYIFGLPK